MSAWNHEKFWLLSKCFEYQHWCIFVHTFLFKSFQVALAIRLLQLFRSAYFEHQERLQGLSSAIIARWPWTESCSVMKNWFNYHLTSHGMPMLAQVFFCLENNSRKYSLLHLTVSSLRLTYFHPAHNCFLTRLKTKCKVLLKNVLIHF